MSSVRNLSLSRLKQPCFLLPHVVLSFLLITVVILWASGCEKHFPIEYFGYGLVGVVRDKETLEPLNEVYVGIKYPRIPDNALIDSSIFINADESTSITYNVIYDLTETREDGYFFLCEERGRFGDSECAKENTSKLIAWKSGYKLWKFDARLDTISGLDNDRIHINIYMEKLDNQ